jgi:EAL domain-containing protein (putative c-di-GMP-specific phosphodiesterase class I)
VISRVNDKNRYLFDQLCRVKAISLASKLNITSMLSINFLPNAIYVPERCIRTTFEAAKQYDFPSDRIMFEFTEVEKMDDTEHVKRIVDYYQSLGFKTAVDDFGSGYSGLNLLADFQTDIIKLDMALIRNIDSNKVRQSIVKNCLTMFNELNITTLAEGIETYDEYAWLRDAGIELMQGYYFAKPGFESLPDINHRQYTQAG